jgi:hypothetical protein
VEDTCTLLEIGDSCESNHQFSAFRSLILPSVEARFPSATCFRPPLLTFWAFSGCLERADALRAFGCAPIHCGTHHPPPSCSTMGFASLTRPHFETNAQGYIGLSTAKRSDLNKVDPLIHVSHPRPRTKLTAGTHHYRPAKGLHHHLSAHLTQRNVSLKQDRNVIVFESIGTWLRCVSRNHWAAGL